MRNLESQPMEVATVAWLNVYVPISAQVAPILRRFAENQ